MSGSYQDWIVLTLELRLNSYKTRLTKRDINSLSRKMLRGGCKAGWFLFSELVSLLVLFCFFWRLFFTNIFVEHLHSFSVCG